MYEILLKYRPELALKTDDLFAQIRKFMEAADLHCTAFFLPSAEADYVISATDKRITIAIQGDSAQLSGAEALRPPIVGEKFTSPDNQHQTGMTYRQWLIGMALQGAATELFHAGADASFEEDIDSIVRLAEKVADLAIARQEEVQ